MWTYRIKYSKLGRVRFISHLDAMRVIKRAIRRADIPVAYTAGFNPRPRISMGPALPLGYESVCELADITLERMFPPTELHRRLMETMPQGLDLLETGWVLGASPRLSNATSACYMIELLEGITPEDARRLVQEFLQKDSVPVEKVRKDESIIIDVKRFVIDLGVEAEADSRWLRAEIAMGGQGSCSASEVAQAVLKLAPDTAKRLKITRTDIRFNGRPPGVRTDEKTQQEEEEVQEEP